MDMKCCSKCGLELPLSEFSSGSRCKKCVRSYNRAWRRAHPGAAAARSRKWRDAHPEVRVKAVERSRRWIKDNQERYRDTYLRRMYGITLAQYQELLVSQGGKCPGCLRTFSDEVKSHVDHCHATGVVRGVLCAACNTLLGALESKLGVDRVGKLLAYRCVGQKACSP